MSTLRSGSSGVGCLPDGYFEQSFETEEARNLGYSHTTSGSGIQDLNNKAGNGIVDSTSASTMFGLIGFDLKWNPLGQASLPSAGDRGVITAVSAGRTASDGNNVYTLARSTSSATGPTADFALILEFEEIAVSVFAATKVSVDIYMLQDMDVWDPSDSLNVYLILDGDTTTHATILNVDGP